MSDNIPSEFNEVFSRLEEVIASGNRMSGRVSQFKGTLRGSLTELKNISETKINQIRDLINRLKQNLAELERANAELKQKLESNQSEFGQQLEGLNAQQASQMEELKAQLAAEKAELENSFSERSNMSESEKAQAIARAQQAAATQLEELRAAHQAELSELEDQYKREHDSLIQALLAIAQRQGEAINKIGAELNEEELTGEFSNVQQQIVTLLDSISQLLTDGSGQHIQEQLPLPPSGFPQEESANTSEKAVPNIDLDAIENSIVLEDIPRSAGDPPQTENELLKYMLEILAMRFKSGEMSVRQQEFYTETIKPEFNNLKTIPAGDPRDNKSIVYGIINNFFNSTKDISPITRDQIALPTNFPSRGGRRTRRHRKVHFKTRGKKGGKRGGKRGGKSHKGGKKSKGKRTRKH